MKSPQNVFKMSTVSPDTSRETATPLTNGCNNNRIVQVFLFDYIYKSLCFSYAKRH